MDTSLKSYQGPAFKEGYKPSREDFLSDIENTMAKIEKVWGLVKNGDIV